MGTPSLGIPGLGIPSLGTPGKSYASIVQAWRPLIGILVTVYKWLKSNTLSADDSSSSYYQLLERGLVNLGRVKNTVY